MWICVDSPSHYELCLTYASPSNYRVNERMFSQVQFNSNLSLSISHGLSAVSICCVSERVKCISAPTLFPGLVYMHNITLLRTIFYNLGPLARYSVCVANPPFNNLSAYISPIANMVTRMGKTWNLL